MSKIDNPHDEPDAVEARKNQEDPWILYLIVRESLNMSTGKIAAQVGHAVGMVYEKYMTYSLLSSTQARLHCDDFNHWSNESFRKIVLRASDKDWENIKDLYQCFVVRDAGLTQVAAGSETVIALWPMKKSSVPKLIRRLRVL